MGYAVGTFLHIKDRLFPAGKVPLRLIQLNWRRENFYYEKARSVPYTVGAVEKLPWWPTTELDYVVYSGHPPLSLLRENPF